ncbi:hypothetical protein PENSPDRAFT_595290, partial [Peniophora sp. CONT]
PLSTSPSPSPSRTPVPSPPPPPFPIMATPRRMPVRGDSAAPTSAFNVTHPATIFQYWEDLEYLFDDCSITTDDKKKQHAARLAPSSEILSWRKLDEYTEATKSWDDFKKAVNALYLGIGVTTPPVYELEDLSALVVKYQTQGIKTIADYQVYHRKYLEVGNELVTSDVLSKLDLKKGFVEAFQPELKKKILDRLEITKPLVLPGRPYEIADVDEAARHLLHGTRTLASEATTTTGNTVVKAEDLQEAMKSMAQTFAQSIAASLGKNNSSSSSSKPSYPVYNPNAQANVAGQTTGCRFCGEPGHFIKECLVAEDYVKTGRAGRNERGELVLPNGRYAANSLPGATLRERMDNWHKLNASQASKPAPPASGMLFATPVSATPRSIARPPAPTYSPYVPPAPRPNAANASKASAAPDSSSAAKRNDPAFKNLPPVADTKDAQGIYDRCMDSTVVLTQRELLSLAPDIRYKVREAVSARRSRARPDPLLDMPTAFAAAANPVHPTFLYAAKLKPEPYADGFRIDDPFECYVNDLPPGMEPAPLVVGPEGLAIREITSVLDNQGSVNCIIDPGCSIITISQGVAHEFGVVYDSNRTIPLQSANGQIDHSLGLARNVPFKLGNLTLYVQAHVIRTPAYDVLFGRPFDALGETIIRNYCDGSQDITVHDPNSDTVVTVPTRPRSETQFHDPHTHVHHGGFRNH